jgi:hypothetical protein
VKRCQEIIQSRHDVSRISDRQGNYAFRILESTDSELPCRIIFSLNVSIPALAFRHGFGSTLQDHLSSKCIDSGPGIQARISHFCRTRISHLALIRDP